MCSIRRCTCVFDVKVRICSGGATGYAGYAPAYPAILATKLYACIRDYESQAWACTSASREREAARQARKRSVRPTWPATKTRSRNNADANTELRIEVAIGWTLSVRPALHPRQYRSFTLSAITLPYDGTGHSSLWVVTSCPVRPSPCPTTAPATGI
jgi:hypothetical protein